MLRIEDLKVEIEGRVVLDHVNLEVPEGKTHVLFGPNGSGKTSLLMTIMGFEGYKVLSGKIFFKGQDVTNLPIYERAKLGIGMSFQRPPSVDGLKLGELLHLIGCEEDKIEAIASEIRFEPFLGRDVNVGFSGGEIKRSELLQLMAQQPDLLLFDEPESGVDLESISLIGNAINNLIKGTDGGGGRYCHKTERAERKRSGLIITHTGYILDYVDADEGHVLYNGRIACQANARELLREISVNGYEECLKCQVQ
jgi:Fe-S cluster assembly ATP-binding protein